MIADKSINIQHEVTRNHEYAITEILDTKIILRKKVLCIIKIEFKITFKLMENTQRLERTI